MPTHCTIRTNDGGHHLKSWLVETSADGKNWRKVAHEEDNKQLTGSMVTAAFPIAGAGDRFIRLVNIGRNYLGIDRFIISVWEIFGNLIE
jgi:hypothetical protein